MHLLFYYLYFVFSQSTKILGIHLFQVKVIFEKFASIGWRAWPYFLNLLALVLECWNRTDILFLNSQRRVLNYGMFNFLL